MLEKHGAKRLPFAHCYEFFAGAAQFNEITEEEIGSFFLTDYLARNFNRLVIGGLGLDKRPHLRDLYFANYTRVVYLAQTHDPDLDAAAAAAAERLQLNYEYRFVGYGELQTSIIAAAAGVNAKYGESCDVRD